MKRIEKGFRFARELVKAGWCRGVSMKNGSHGNVQRSVVQALRDSFFNWDEAYTRMTVRETFRTANRITVRGLTEWNDRSGRTKAQVLRAFDRAIAYAKRMGM